MAGSLPGVVAVQDSKGTAGPALTFAPSPGPHSSLKSSRDRKREPYARMRPPRRGSIGEVVPPPACCALRPAQIWKQTCVGVRDIKQAVLD
nr:hypothetical protein [Micromonospora saelicesensis]